MIAPPLVNGDHKTNALPPIVQRVRITYREASL
jgi:hypothetical protein